MKLLRITAKGLPLFKDEFDICFYAQQRINEESKRSLHNLFGNVYLNTANGIIGINASGKTSILKLINFVFEMVNNQPINHIKTKDVLGDSKNVLINTYFYSEEGKIYLLETHITSEKNSDNSINYKIVYETLWSKNVSTSTIRKSLLVFDKSNNKQERSSNEEYLPDDVSIIIAHNKRINDHINIVNFMGYTNFNILTFFNGIPIEVIQYLDPTIEYINYDSNNQNSLIHLKFFNKDEIILNNPLSLCDYLSSGTIKGMMLFTLSISVLKDGGVLIVDEIENHFNKEIVSTLIRFFMNTNINTKGGMLIFTTHYPELLDIFDRNDSLFVTRNEFGIKLECLSNILKRNDIKKSDLFQSGYLGGTTPLYDSYIKLKNKIASEIK